jgi:heptosyltransferase-3
MRILIYRLGSLGDTVLALPSFRVVRAAYPQATITVLTNAPVSGKAAPLESILAGTGLVDAVIPYPLGLRDPLQVAALIRRLRREKFDLVVSLAAARGRSASVRDWFFFRACGIRRIAGVPFQPRDLACEREADGPFYESEAKRLLRRVQEFGSADLADPRSYNLSLTAEEKAEAQHLLAGAGVTGPFLAASLGTKTPLNDWGERNWRQLLGELGPSHPGLGLVLLGSADEAARSQALLDGWPGPTANLCGRASARVSAAVLARAALYLGHDSGPMHLAAAAGAQCVAVYSVRCPPGQWFPLGPGHTNLYPLSFFDPARITEPNWQQQALASIRVEAVRAAVAATLEGTGSASSIPTRL